MHNFATRERCLAVVIMTTMMLFASNSYAQGWERDGTKTGAFSEDLFVGARKITVRATVNGDIMAMGEDVDVDATVVGDVTFIQSERPEAVMGQAFAAAGAIWLSVVAGLILLGIVLLLVSPNLPFEAAAQIRRRPWASIGLGMAVLFGSQIGMLILVVTGIGLPLAVVMAGLYVVVLALGLLDFAILVGHVLGVLEGVRAPRCCGVSLSSPSALLSCR